MRFSGESTKMASSELSFSLSAASGTKREDCETNYIYSINKGFEVTYLIIGIGMRFLVLVSADKDTPALLASSNPEAGFNLSVGVLHAFAGSIRLSVHLLFDSWTIRFALFGRPQSFSQLLLLKRLRLLQDKERLLGRLLAQGLRRTRLLSRLVRLVFFLLNPGLLRATRERFDLNLLWRFHWRVRQLSSRWSFGAI